MPLRKQKLSIDFLKETPSINHLFYKYKHAADFHPTPLQLQS